MKGSNNMMIPSKKNWDIVNQIKLYYPELTKYFVEKCENCEIWGTEKCHYKTNKYGCKYCQRNGLVFYIPQCSATGIGVSYSGIVEKGEPDLKVVALMESYPNLFEIMECSDCCGCGDW